MLAQIQLHALVVLINDWVGQDNLGCKRKHTIGAAPLLDGARAWHGLRPITIGKREMCSVLPNIAGGQEETGTQLLLNREIPLLDDGRFQKRRPYPETSAGLTAYAKDGES